MTKRLLFLGLAIALLLGACSSGSSNEESGGEPEDQPAEQEEQVEPDPDDTTSTEDGEDPEPEPEPEAEPDPTATPPPTPTPQPTRTVPEPDSGGEATGPLDEADVEIETDEGTIQIGEAEVPEGVDAAFPVPDDMEVQLSSEAGDQFGFTGVTQMTIDELIVFYTEGLPAAGYEIVETQEIEGVLAVYSFESDDVEGQVAISEAPGGAGSSVLVTIGAGSDAFSIEFGDVGEDDDS